MYFCKIVKNIKIYFFNSQTKVLLRKPLSGHKPWPLPNQHTIQLVAIDKIRHP